MAAPPRPGSGNGDGVEAHQSAERLLAQRHNGLLPMGHLQCRGLYWQDLGIGTEMFQSLCSRAGNSLDLLQDPATQAMLRGWQCDGQQELLSFTSHFLGWCHPRLVDNTWERRFEEAAQLKCHDQGGKLGPIILTPAASAEKKLDLQACVDEWHTQYGMITALLRAQTCVAVYIEKSQFMPQGTPAKAPWSLQLPPNGVIWLPRFREAGDTAVDHVAYQVSSLIVHSGSHEAGHYRACCQGHNGWISFQDNWEARQDHALHQEPGQDILLVWLVDADRYLTCPPAATPSALMKDELVTHAVRCYVQANYGVFQAQDSLLARLLRTTCPVCGIPLMSYSLFEEHVQSWHWELWHLGKQHMQATWPQWTDEVLPCVWCGGSLNLEKGPVKLQPHSCQMLAAIALATAFHARELEPMGSIFDLRLRPSERIQWALADNTALNEALQEAADPELYAAAGESAAAFGTELQRRGERVRVDEVWEGLEEPDSLDQGLADFLAQLDASWPA